MFNDAFKKRGCYLVLAFSVLVVVMCAPASADEWGQRAHLRLEQFLQTESTAEPQGCVEPDRNLRAEVYRFYQYRHFRPAWVDHHGLLPEGEAVLKIIRQATRQGLVDPDNGQRLLEASGSGMLANPTTDWSVRLEYLIKLDVMVTESVLWYAHSITSGRTAPALLRFGDQPGPAAQRDLAVKLAVVRDNRHLASFLGQLGPRHAQYQALQKGLQTYRALKATGGWPVIDQGPPLQFGDHGARVALLRYRLAVSGDTDFAPGAVNDRYDDALALAVMRFQRRHGLPADGILGAGTLAAMNVSVDERIRQIELNLERWRWLPAQFEPYHIFVNIPAFELTVVDGGQTVQTQRVVVGRKDRPTPMLASTMTYLELNPYWNVPATIAREDLLPKIQKDPQFLTRRNFQVFDSWDENASALDPRAIDWATFSEDHFPLRLRQAPTPYNALGRVKFMFPNPLSVYIHDTPSKGLFGRASRDFSSGCVRVEKPLALAALLLKRQGWSAAQLAQTLEAGERQVVILKSPVPVYLVYMTAWAEENGELHFREDIYGQDRELQTLLTETVKAKQQCTAVGYPTYLVKSGKGVKSANGL